jgi:hypothetical protein
MYQRESDQMTNINLIDLSTTFPEPPSDEIPVDSTVTAFQRRFGPGNERIIVVGPSGSGKTVHLSQFVRQFPDRCFSYFLTDDVWTSSPGGLLFGLCTQMNASLGNEALQAIEDVNRLRTLFNSLSQKVVELARRQKTSYYFVIDGLEFARQGPSGDRIADLLPLPSNSKGLYFLGSVRSESLDWLTFTYRSEEPHLFSLLEIQTFLSDLNFTTDELRQIQNVSAGMPGYLAAVRLLSQRKVPLNRILEAPSEIEGVLGIQWAVANVEGNSAKELLLASLAYSLVSPSVDLLCEVVGRDVGEVEGLLTETGLIKVNQSKEVQFHSELLKRVAQRRLGHLKKEALAKLTNYYETRKDSPPASILLSQYYFEAGDYKSLTELMAPNHLVAMIEARQDLTFARRQLSQATEMAAAAHDLKGIVKFGLATSELRTLSNQLIGESEVMALVALGRYDQALNLAYSASLTETRIQLLTRVYLEMQRANRMVSREAISEVEQMTQGIGETLEPDQLVRLAVTLFPLLPDIATSLIEQAQVREATTSMLDVAVTMASSQVDDSQGNQLIDRIQNVKLREMALVTAPWLSELTASQVLHRATEIERVQAKEYLLRQWCRQNKTNPALHTVVDAALTVIDANPDKVPLRNLRQLAEVVCNCPAESRETLVKRFDIPNFTNLRSPIEERIRLELSLAEAMVDISENQAFDRFIETYNSLQTAAVDIDVACYCYTRVLIALSRLDPNDGLRIRSSIQQAIEDTFQILLNTSADQLKISRPIIRSLASVKPDLALTCAESLNLQERRELAIQDALLAYVWQERIPISYQVVADGLASIPAKEVKDRVVRNLIAEASDRDLFATNPSFRELIKLAQGIMDPIARCQSLACLIGAFDQPESKDLRRELFENFLEAWNVIDVVWIRIEAAFDLIEDVAKNEPAYAVELYDKTRTLRDTSSLANQTIGNMYYRLLGLAVRAGSRLDLTMEAAKVAWSDLLALVYYVPSSLLRVQLYAMAALGRLWQGDKTTFDSLMRDSVMPVINTELTSDIEMQVVANIAPAIFEYSRSAAKSILDQLPYVLRNNAWAKAATVILLKTNIEDPIDAESPNASIDLQTSDRIQEILDSIEYDTSLYPVIRAFTHAIENPESQLNEAQRLNILAKLDDLVEKKLPDPKNIKHNGFLLACQSAIERARVKSAKKAKAQLKKQHPQLIKKAQGIGNSADRVLVMVWIAEDLESINPQSAEALVNEALGIVPQILNARDRIERLDAIADAFQKLHKTEKGIEAIRIAFDLVPALQGVTQEELLASLIQTAHKLDEELAAKLTERVEDSWQKSVTADLVRTLNLARSPQKLISDCASSLEDAKSLPRAADEMLQALIAGRGVIHSTKVLEAGLCSTRFLDFHDSLSIANWATETILRQSADHSVAKHALAFVESIIQTARLLFDLGNRIAFLSTVPMGIRQGFQGLATRVIVFRVGEREKALSWIRKWMQANGRDYVEICDPYFDLEQLWILQTIPTDVRVTIATTWKTLEHAKIPKNTRAAEEAFKQAWTRRSCQDPPSTLVLIQDPESNDEYHDRYILSREVGLSVGTSLNGIGNREFAITVLTPEDVTYIQDNYVGPRTDLQRRFSETTFFKLGEF